MTKLSRAYLEAIVSEFGHLEDVAYSDDFCWESDVGNMVTPLQFAEHCDNAGKGKPRDFLDCIVRSAEDAANHLTWTIQEQNEQRDEDNRIERDCGLLIRDIFRNILLDAKEALEDLES